MRMKYVALLLVAAVAVSALIASSVTARGTPIAYWGANRLKAYYTYDFVGIGTSNPLANLHVTGVNNGPEIFRADTSGMTVSVPFTLSSDLAVGGNLQVSGSTDLDGPLDVSGSTTMGGTLDLSTNAGSGPVATFRNLDNGDGIDIQVQNADPNNGNNYVTFLNSSGVAQGRIEGETLAEILTSFDYIWATTFETLGVAFQTAMVIADVAGVDDADAAIIEGIELVDYIAQWVKLQDDLLGSPGVAFESGSGDYAEWLEKADPKETFSSGDVVGVHAGRISKSTKGADHYMVISQNPIVLGNMPPADRKADFEKVAFMGQVRVKVAGPVRKGDYILPSARNDGFAIAVSPEDMTLPAYRQIVGVAWEASTAAAGLSYINTAVGINANDLVARMIRQQQEIDAVKNRMNAIAGYLQSKDPSFKAELFDIEPVVSADVAPTRGYAAMTPSERVSSVAAVLRRNPEMVEAVLEDARDRLTARGIDFRRFEQTERLLTDPEYLIDILEGYERR